MANKEKIINEMKKDEKKNNPETIDFASENENLKQQLKNVQEKADKLEQYAREITEKFQRTTKLLNDFVNSYIEGK